MTKKPSANLKLPDDFLGTVQAFLNTAPPPKKKATMTPKPQWEEKIFREFCTAAAIKLDAESVRHGNERDEPDILCTIEGRPASFELAEVVDESLAAGMMKAIKTGAITGGAYGHHRPLLRTTVNHLVKCYTGAVGPLSLLLHFDKQYPPPAEFGIIEATLDEVATAALEPNRWHSLWVFCTWQKKVLAKWPKPESGRAAKKSKKR